MFRFTIRDVLWLTVVVALCFGWWAENRYLAHRTGVLSYQLDALKRLIERQGFEVRLDDSETETGVFLKRQSADASISN